MCCNLDGVRAAEDAAYPSMTLSNEFVSLDLRLPCRTTGYYRGLRFDASSVIVQATVAGHTFFGRLHSGAHNPDGHDNIAGPVEEFGMYQPLGYAEAEHGGSFLKIGVGRLRKPIEPEQAYSFSRKYELLENFPWEIERTDNGVRFEQQASDPAGWGYRLVREVSLVPGSPEVHIARTLTNTGEHAFETDHYAHNFVRIDDRDVGADYALRFSFEPSIVESRPDGKATLQGGVLRFIKPQLDKAVWMSLEGFGAESGQVVEVSLGDDAPAVAFEQDRALSAFCVYAVRSTLSPEPFVTLSLAPGESVSWSTRIRFRVPSE